MPGLPLDPSAPPAAKMKSFISSSADSGCGAEKLPGGHCVLIQAVPKRTSGLLASIFLHM